jgi:hypothetical protein
MATVELKDDQDIVLSVDPNQPALDRKGNPAAKIDAGSVQFFVDNPALLEVKSVSEDGNSVKLGAIGPLGTANVTVKATAGGEACAGTIELVIGSDAPVSIQINAGTPTDQESAPPA